jgi:thiol-disulfide isomerase/thioredoxin
MSWAVATLVIFTATAQDTAPDPKAIVEEALSTYKALDSLSVTGEAFAEMKMGTEVFKMGNAFTVLTARPNKFLVSWEPKGAVPMMAGGAVWNEGDEPFLYMGTGNMYTPMSDTMMALAAATGVSNGAAHTLPSLFFAGDSGFMPGVLGMLHDHQHNGEEELNGEMCHVITAASPVSSKHTLWISKERHILLKHQYTLGGEDSPALPELTEEDREEAVEGLGGGEKAEELVEESAETAKMMSGLLKDMDALMGEVYIEIELNPELAEDAFAFALPEGAARQESFFDAIQAATDSVASEYNQMFQVGDTVPEFSGTRLDGTELKLADYKGKVVLLDFWATWCGPCIAALPDLIETYEKYGKQGLEVVGISLDDAKDDLTAFMKKNDGMEWPILFDGKGWASDIAQAYGVEAIPFTLLIDGDRVVKARDLDGAELNEAIEALLAASKAE